MRYFLQVTRNALINSILLFVGYQAPAQLLASSKMMAVSSHTAQANTLSLREVLIQFKARYHVEILFEDRLVNLSVNSAVIETTATLEENLTKVLQPHDLRFKKVKEGIYVIVKSRKAPRVATQTLPTAAENTGNLSATLLTQPTLQRSNTLDLPVATQAETPIQGKVTDEKGEGLPGVSIVLKGTQKGTTSDSEGRYKLDVPSSAAILIFSFVGYMPQEMAVGSRITLDVTLRADDKTLEEIVVVGYGTQKRKDLTGAVGTVDSKEIKEMSVTRIDQALLGKVAGVQVKPVSGEPGAPPQIRIRGIGSISAGAGPLYVVDGFPTQTIETLNPNDVESLDVLKDASATAIYGSRGSNGVIIINTKRGRSGKPNITFDTYYGFQKVSKLPQFMTAREQAQYFYDGVKNRNIDGGFNVAGPGNTWNFKAPQLIMDVLEGRNTTDVEPLDEVLRVAPQQQYQLSATGGSESMKYAVSGEYFNQDGLIINSNFKRYSMRVNLDAKLSDRLALKLNFNPSFIDKGNVNSSGVTVGAGDFSVMGAATSVNPFYPIYDDKGGYFWYNGLEAVGNLVVAQLC